MKAKWFIVFSLILISHYFSMAQCNRANIVNDYLTNYEPNDFSVNEINWTGNVNNCTTGNYNYNINTKMLNRIKFLRRICALNDDVVFVESLNAKCREAILMFEKNENISHCLGTNGAPCNTWSCNSADAILAAQRSNISYGDWDYFDPFELYILEEGSFNDAVPHMKWLLYSKAKTFGNAIGPNMNVIYIYDNFGNPSMNQKDYIAFPPEGFVPAPIIKNKWFFAVPNANFSNATVTITNENGNNIPLTIATRNSTFGDRAITWIVDNIDTNNIYDVSYTVTVSNITNAPSSTYSYTIIVTQPIHPPPCPSNLVWSDNDCGCVSAVSCVQLLNINNQNLATGTYQASNQIMVENSTVTSNRNVNFFAKNRVSIQENFRVSAGASLKIDIRNCQ